VKRIRRRVLRQVPRRDSGSSRAQLEAPRRHAGIHAEFTAVSAKRRQEREFRLFCRRLRFLQETRPRRSGSAESAWRDNSYGINLAALRPRSSRSSRFDPIRSDPIGRSIEIGPRSVATSSRFLRAWCAAGESVFAVLYPDTFASCFPSCCFFPSFSFCRRGGIDDRSSSAADDERLASSRDSMISGRVRSSACVNMREDKRVRGDR